AGPKRWHNPFRVEIPTSPQTQGSSFLATLGFVAESLRDSSSAPGPKDPWKKQARASHSALRKRALGLLVGGAWFCIRNLLISRKSIQKTATNDNRKTHAQTSDPVGARFLLLDLAGPLVRQPVLHLERQSRPGGELETSCQLCPGRLVCLCTAFGPGRQVGAALSF